MCTSFSVARPTRMVAMNFDSDGMPYRLDTRSPGWFIVRVDAGRGFFPSFGVSARGEFFSALMVDDTEAGRYRRGKNVVHTNRLIQEFIAGQVQQEGIADYLARREIVNGPGQSLHCHLIDTTGDAWILEPGRGNTRFPSTDDSPVILTNMPLASANACSRFRTVQQQLTKVDRLDLDSAMEILTCVRQSGPEWSTGLSLVFDGATNTVVYDTAPDWSRTVYSFGDASPDATP